MNNISVILIALGLAILMQGCLENFFKPKISPSPTPEALGAQDEIQITQKALQRVAQSSIPATPSYAAKMKFFAPDPDSCSKIGGSWLTIGGKAACYVNTRDGNRQCTDSSQCQGYCISHSLGSASGICAQTIPLQGCDYELINGQTKGKVCLW